MAPRKENEGNCRHEIVFLILHNNPQVHAEGWRAYVARPRMSKIMEGLAVLMEGEKSHS